MCNASMAEMLEGRYKSAEGRRFAFPWS